MRKFRVAVIGLWTAALAAAPAHATLIDFQWYQDGSAAHALQLARPSIVPEPYELPIVEDGPLAGYFASIEPGWDGLKNDDLSQERYGLLHGDGVVIRRVSASPGFIMFDSLLNPILSADGETELLFGGNEGNPDLYWHEHLRFAMEPGTPVGAQVTITIVGSDLLGMHAESAEYTLTFVATPEPASVALLALGALLAARRR